MSPIHETATQAARLALGWIGTPYLHQSDVRGLGCDCLGLLRGVRRELGFPDVAVPAYAPGWGELEPGGEPLLDAACRLLVPRHGRDPEPGDVIVFRMIAAGPAKHCGIALDASSFVHAYSGIGAVRSALSEPWRRRIAGLFSFPEPERSA